MSKQIIFNEACRKSILLGVEKLSRAVSATMGPKGRNVIIEHLGAAPLVTKDGVSVANEIDLEDPLENMGAQLVKEAATKTNDIAGDGTTTATILAYEMMKGGMEHLDKGANPILIKRGMDKAVTAVCAELEKMKKDVDNKEEYMAIATISAQDSDIGLMIADVIHEAGDAGVITVEKGQTFGLEKEFVKGMQFDNGYISPYFVTDEDSMKSVFEDAYILITDYSISSIQQLIPLIEKMMKADAKELVIICENLEGEALQGMVVNKLRGIFKCLAVKAPGFGASKKDLLGDIAAVTGGTVISQEIGLKLEDVNLEDLGRCATVTSTVDKTTILGGMSEEKDIDSRAKLITEQIKNSDSAFDSTTLGNRLARLTSGIAVIKVGAATKVEQIEKQHRVEDALSATRAAAEEGILPGGGTALIRVMNELDELESADSDETIGINIVLSSLSAPAKYIIENAGKEAAEILNEIITLDGNIGYNALTDEFEDLVKAKVIDPKKVTRCALEYAASVAGMFLTLSVGITEIRDPQIKQ